MRTLFTSIGFAILTILLASMLLLPVQPARSAQPRPLALTQTAEPPTQTPTNTPTATNTPTPTNTPTATSTPTPTNTPTNTPVVPTSTPTNTPAVPTVTPTGFVPQTPTATPPVNATARPTLVPTSTPTVTVTPRKDPGGGPEVADPYVTKRANLDSVQVGDFVEFTLTVGNNGPGPAHDVVVRDPVPGFLTIYNATTTRGLISVSGNTVTIEIGTVAPGEIITIVIRTRVNQIVAPPDNLNTATLSTSSPDANPDNNRSTVGVTTGAAPTATPAVGDPTSPSPSPSAPPQTTPTSPAAPAVTTSPVPPVTGTTPRPTATAPVQLPTTGANGTNWLWPLLLLALSAVLAGTALRRRSVR